MDKKEHIDNLTKFLQTKSKLYTISLFADANELATEYYNTLSQQKEVDLDELRNEFLLSFNFDYPCGYNNIWEFFLPHLQKPVESDALELTTKEINKSCDENIEGVGLIYIEMAAIYKKGMRNAVKLINAKKQFKQLMK